MINSSSDLTTHHCVPCEGGTKPMTRAEFSVYLDQVPDWQIVDNEKALQKEFTLKNFVATVAYIDEIAKVAQAEGHHPDLFLHDYKKLTITLSTRAIKGLSVNDFVMATKIDALPH